MTIILVSLAFALVIILSVALLYNRLVALRNRYTEAHAQIDVQLKRRHDLIPNLVETVKGAMNHERETLEAVIQARNTAVQALDAAKGLIPGADNFAALASAETALSGALSKLMAVVEAYPDLKANENMNMLTEELSSTENKIAFSRQHFNDQVRVFNTFSQSFPAVVLARSFGFNDAAYLEFEGTAFREAPKVSF